MSAATSKKILKLHRTKKQYRGHSSTENLDFIVEFLFSMSDENGQHPEPFWCEVHLKENLREHGSWKKIGDKELPKAMYLYAVDCLKKAGGRPTRHLDMNWIPGSEYAEGPPWDIASVDLKNTQSVSIDDDGILPVVVDQH
jgi:hypothetical protein